MLFFILIIRRWCFFLIFYLLGWFINFTDWFSKFCRSLGYGNISWDFFVSSFVDFWVFSSFSKWYSGNVSLKNKEICLNVCGL